MKAGLGTALRGDVAAAACADRFAESETFRRVVCGVCVAAVRLYGDRAAGAGVEENRRTCGKHWVAFLAGRADNMTALMRVWVMSAGDAWER